MMKNIISEPSFLLQQRPPSGTFQITKVWALSLAQRNMGICFPFQANKNLTNTHNKITSKYKTLAKWLNVQISVEMIQILSKTSNSLRLSERGPQRMKRMERRRRAKASVGRIWVITCRARQPSSLQNAPSRLTHISSRLQPRASPRASQTPLWAHLRPHFTKTINPSLPPPPQDSQCTSISRGAPPSRRSSTDTTSTSATLRKCLLARPDCSKDPPWTGSCRIRIICRSSSRKTQRMVILALTSKRWPEATKKPRSCSNSLKIGQACSFNTFSKCTELTTESIRSRTAHYWPVSISTRPKIRFAMLWRTWTRRFQSTSGSSSRVGKVRHA